MFCFKKISKKCFCRCFEKISTNGGVTRAQYENMFAKYLGSQVCQSWFFILFFTAYTHDNVRYQPKDPQKKPPWEAVRRSQVAQPLALGSHLLHFVDFGKTLNLYQEVGPVTPDVHQLDHVAGKCISTKNTIRLSDTFISANKTFIFSFAGLEGQVLLPVWPSASSEVDWSCCCSRNFKSTHKPRCNS